MPMDRSLYPQNWEAIAQQVKDEAGWRCEQCGRVCRRPRESLPDFCQRIEGVSHPDLDWVNQTAIATILDKPQRWTLTVAHLDHIPQNSERSNLKALCAPCHCRYDLSQMARKKFLKREREGQLSLFTPEQGESQ